MHMIEFKITDPERVPEGIVELARRMRVTCLNGERYVVAEGGLTVLDRLGISYTVLAREPFCYERHAIPDLVAAQIS